MANLLWYGIDLGTRTNLVALKFIGDNQTEPVTEAVEFPRYGTAYPSYVYVDKEKVLSGRMAEDAYHDQSYEEHGSSYYMIWEPKMILAEAGGEDKEIHIGEKHGMSAIYWLGFFWIYWKKLKSIFQICSLNI